MGLQLFLSLASKPSKSKLELISSDIDKMIGMPIMCIIMASVPVLAAPTDLNLAKSGDWYSAEEKAQSWAEKEVVRGAWPEKEAAKEPWAEKQRKARAKKEPCAETKDTWAKEHPRAKKDFMANLIHLKEAEGLWSEKEAWANTWPLAERDFMSPREAWGPQADKLPEATNGEHRHQNDEHEHKRQHIHERRGKHQEKHSHAYHHHHSEANHGERMNHHHDGHSHDKHDNLQHYDEHKKHEADWKHQRKKPSTFLAAEKTGSFTAFGQKLAGLPVLFAVLTLLAVSCLCFKLRGCDRRRASFVSAEGVLSSTPSPAALLQTDAQDV